ncbi:MAG TPA: hypothetical protein DCM87_01090 [Planctomycetes bacterium]|nr:hypothetical protein [Planctomycetota bacterium]
MRQRDRGGLGPPGQRGAVGEKRRDEREDLQAELHSGTSFTAAGAPPHFRRMARWIGTGGASAWPSAREA